MHNSLQHPIRISLPQPYKRYPLNSKARPQDELNEPLIDKITNQYFKRLVNWRVSAELKSASNGSVQKQAKPGRLFRASKVHASLLRSKLKNKLNAGKQRTEKTDGGANSFLKQTPNRAGRRTSYEESWELDSRSHKQQWVSQSRPCTLVPNSPKCSSPSRFYLRVPKRQLEISLA
jgi:hypothetical protein